MSEEPAVEHAPETGEVAAVPLSEQATNGIQRPKYWNRVDAIDGEGGANYELAFFEAQSLIDAMIEADAKNPAFKSRYATLAGLLARVRPVLTLVRLTIKQYPGRIHRLGLDSGTKQTFLPVVTKLTHVDSGEWEAFCWEMPLLKVDPQAIGSASTYAKRFAIAGIFGIATVDDDAAASSIRNSIEKNQGADVIDGLIAQIKEAKTLADLRKWYESHRDGIDLLSEDKVERLRVAYAERVELLQKDEDTQDKTDAPSTKAKK